MGMTIDNVLEILEKHKLHIPSNVFYELKADIVNFEEPTTKDDAPENNVGNIEPTTNNDLGVDCISRADALALYCDKCGLYNCISKCASYRAVEKMPSVTPQEPKCKNCKWWKDSDGEYRRGCGAESQCPINRREVFEGNGYCYLFESQESEG